MKIASTAQTIVFSCFGVNFCRCFRGEVDEVRRLNGSQNADHPQRCHELEERGLEWKRPSPKHESANAM